MKNLSPCVFGSYALLLLFSCFKSTEAETADNTFDHPRQLYFSADDPDYDNYEGTSGDNHCQHDQDCIISGCSDSACAAEEIEIEDVEFCERRMMSQAISVPYGQCGCIDHDCRWYFENDFDRDCETDDDCDGLGTPPEGARKANWFCRDGSCQPF